MSHEITATDGAFFGGREPAWHGLGTVIDADVVTTHEAINLAGLDWTVEQHDVFARAYNYTDGEDFDPDSYQDINAEGYTANVRSDTGTILGIVSDRYVPVQNTEAFAFMDEVLGGGDAHWHTAGSLQGGRKVWMLARLNRDIMIGGEETERIDPYICLATSHDASLALSVYTTPIRVVCMNTLRWSLKGTKNIWRTKHTTDIRSRMAIARQTLGLSAAYFDELQRIGDELIAKPMSRADFARMLDALVPLPPQTGDGGSVRLRNAEAKRELITQAITVDNLANVRDTRWGFVQAVAEYEDWMRPAKDDEVRARRTLLGDQNSLKTRSVELALAY